MDPHYDVASANDSALRHAATPSPETPKKGGWKCNPEWMFNNMTDTERNKLSRKLRTKNLEKMNVKIIRKELRKIKNVESAQRHRQRSKNEKRNLTIRATTAEDRLAYFMATCTCSHKCPDNDG